MALECLQGLESTLATKSSIAQLSRSATSIGANYAEANGASSRKDFRNKIHICKKEAEESKHWISILRQLFPDERPVLDTLYQECQELVMIFQAIVSTLDKRSKEKGSER